jgi:XTP/dITP diphosphohydrolase
MTIWFATGNAHKKTELAAILRTHGVDCRLLIPKDAGLDFDPEETGTSFHENALLKASALYALLDKKTPLFNPGDPVIADDSGICVDALGGRPGIYSARYAGIGNREQGTGNRDAQRCTALSGVVEKMQHGGSPNNGYSNNKGGSALADTAGVGSAKKLESGERNALLLEELGDASDRKARFVCAMALMYHPDRFFVSQETMEGEIVKDLEHSRGTGGFGYDPILFIPELGRTVAELSEEEKNMSSHRGKAGKIIAKIIGTGE